MFNRIKCKEFAKQQLKKRWTIPVLMSLVTFVICSLLSVPDFKDFYDGLMNSGYFQSEYFFYSGYESSATFLSDIVLYLVSAILNVAAINVYLKMSVSPEPVKFSDFIEGFSMWGRAVLLSLWQYLWVFLWSLLFIIPGIIKSIAYSFSSYIICEYPDVSIKKALKISILITNGHKGEIFVTYLSFFGWAILASIPAGLGFLFLVPYFRMTITNVYHSLLKEAVENGKLKMEDLHE